MNWSWLPWLRAKSKPLRPSGATAEPIPPVESDGAQALRAYVRCQACGEPISVRIRLTDEVGRADEGAPYTFFVQKTVIGSGRRPARSHRPPCFRPIELRLEMDARYRVTGGQLQGGSWLTRDQYEKALQEYETSSAGASKNEDEDDTPRG